MPKYVVAVRAITEDAQYEIEANNKAEAKQKALDKYMETDVSIQIDILEEKRSA